MTNEFVAVLERLRHDGVIDAEQRRISSEQGRSIMRAVRRDEDERPLFTSASFRSAIFEGDVLFDGAIFKRRAGFEGAIFERYAGFEGAIFERRAGFEGAVFERRAGFEGATFERQAWFEEATFESGAEFRAARFKRDASFARATFKHHVSLDMATFKYDASFEDADLKSAFRVGPFVVRGQLKLDGASFGDVEIRVSTRNLSCKRTRFHGPAHLKIRLAKVELDEAVFERASTLAFVPRLEWDGPTERTGPLADKQRQIESDTAMPCLVSVRRADVANLTLADIDLSRCLFKGTLGLDGLRLATHCRFDGAPPWPLPKGARLRYFRRWTKRRIICEERRWRLTTRKRTAWADERADDPATPLENEADAQTLANIYRALRKGREDAKAAPAAADFYYGEMEMRRNAARRLTGERFVLWLYWLVSGYGLRAGRALLALAITVLVFALLFDSGGFSPDRSFDRGLLFSIESTSSLFRVPQLKDTVLTARGEALQVVLSLLGPLFLGLALVSLRGHVKR